MCAGVGTKIDPTLCRADRMVGQVLGAVGALPEIFTELEISYFLLRRLLGVRTEGDKKAAKVPSQRILVVYYQLCKAALHLYTLAVFLQVQKLSKNEVLMVNIGSLSTGGRVSAVKADLAKIVLTNPVCTEVGEKIALSRRVEKHWRYKKSRHCCTFSRLGEKINTADLMSSSLSHSLIGWGQIRRGVTITPTVDDDWGRRENKYHHLDTTTIITPGFIVFLLWGFFWERRKQKGLFKVVSSPRLGLQQEEHRRRGGLQQLHCKCRFQSSIKINLTKKLCFCFVKQHNL